MAARVTHEIEGREIIDSGVSDDEVAANPGICRSRRL